MANKTYKRYQGGCRWTDEYGHAHVVSKNCNTEEEAQKFADEREAQMRKNGVFDRIFPVVFNFEKYVKPVYKRIKP